MKEIREVKFANIGCKKQHKVELIKIADRDFDLQDFAESSQSPAEELLTHYQASAITYLKNKGFEEISGVFRYQDGRIIKIDDHLGMPLFAVIQERDKNEQTSEYIAAKITFLCERLILKWPPEHSYCSEALNQAMLIQNLFFQFYLLENVHPQYSAGKARAGNRSNPYKNEAEKTYKHYRLTGLKKSECYRKTAKKLKKLYPDSAPTEATIKFWFKSRKDLP
ncbi:MAG: hypothetical protein ACYC0J_04695 [Gammaproteobacteria bacterium]